MELGDIGEGERSSIIEGCNGSIRHGDSADGGAGVVLRAFTDGNVEELKAGCGTG